MGRKIPGIADDKRAEDGANTGAGAGYADCGGSGSDELGRGVNVSVGGGRLQGAGLSNN